MSGKIQIRHQGLILSLNPPSSTRNIDGVGLAIINWISLI